MDTSDMQENTHVSPDEMQATRIRLDAAINDDTNADPGDTDPKHLPTAIMDVNHIVAALNDDQFSQLSREVLLDMLADVFDAWPEISEEHIKKAIEIYGEEKTRIVLDSCLDNGPFGTFAAAQCLHMIEEADLVILLVTGEGTYECEGEDDSEDDY